MESHLQVVLQNKQSLSRVLLLCIEERGLGTGRGGQGTGRSVFL